MNSSERLRQLVAEVNAGNIESVREAIAHDYYEHRPETGEPSASEVFSDIAADLRVAMPDLHLSVGDLSADGDEVRGRLSITGTKNGPLWGSPPSGAPFGWEVDIAAKSRGDGIAIAFEGVVLPEFLGTLRQLGVVPPPDEMDMPLEHPISLPEALLKALFNGGMADKPCEHIGDIDVTDAETDICDDCVAVGDVWPALRMCLTCGYVGCCDTSKNVHARKHYEATGHPLIRSIRLKEGWIWCYPDSAFFSARTLDKHR